MAGEKEKFTFLPVDVDRLTSDELVEAMSTEEFGAYVLLLFKAWKSDPPCTIPDDDRTLSRWARMTERQWVKIRARVLAPWRPDDNGRLHQKRLLEVHKEVMEKVNKRKESGSRGGQAKAAGASRNPSSNAKDVPGQGQLFDTSEAVPIDETTPKQPASKGLDVNVPEALNTKEFIEAWLLWIKYRREAKKPLTKTGAEMLLKQFVKWGAEAAVTAIHTSISSGWQGIFEPDKKQASQGKDLFGGIREFLDEEARSGNGVE